jgi:hypothetical protein
VQSSTAAGVCSLQVGNHAAVVKFALRGAGETGARPVSAPLADPTALAALQHQPAMDAALRHVVHGLLLGVQEKQAMEHALQVIYVLLPVKMPGPTSLRYLLVAGGNCGQAFASDC